MAFSSAFRRILAGSPTPSSILHSQFPSPRLCSTLTTPKLFVSGLSRNTGDESLRNAFKQFGELVEAKVIVDRATGRSKGFGFVSYETVEEAQRAREGMNAKFLDGWVIFVDPAKPREFKPAQSQPQQESESASFGFRSNKTVGWSA